MKVTAEVRAESPQESRFLRGSVMIIMLIIITLCGLLYWQAGQLKDLQRWVGHSHEVRLKIEELDRILREAESTQRAMLVVGVKNQGDLRKDYYASAGEVSDVLSELGDLVGDNPTQSKKVAELGPLIKKRLETLERNSVELGRMNATERATRINAGIAEADAVEAKLMDMKTVETRLLNYRWEQTRSARFRLLMLATSGSAVGLVMIIVIWWQETKTQKLRHGYQTRLTEARDMALDAVQATSIFVASVSHEIRTPMNGVLGAADLLTRDGRLDRQQRELVETIRYSGEALLDLINDILDLSKLQAGKMDFVTEDFSISEVIEESLALFADAAGRKQLELAHRIEPGLPRRMRGDARRLRQVLINLVGNAVKFTDSGSVLVEVGKEIGDRGRALLRFRVTDTGPGIAKHEQELLFRPFVQVNPTLSRRHAGIGLGLAISREISQRLGGSMGVESELGKGSQFWFTVRLHDAEGTEEQRKILCNGGTLLLLEGRQFTASTIKEHVIAWGMKVVIAPNTDALRSLPLIHDLAAVIIGQTTGNTWQSVAESLSFRKGTRDAPRYLLSLVHAQPRPEELAAAGVQTCLRFPFRPSDLYNLLARDGHEPSLPEEEEHPLPQARILLVEDNPINQRIFSRQIEMLGLTLVICGDGQDGVVARQTGEFDLILMDCQLPTVDGFEATRRIRQWEETFSARRIPIIAVTAHVMTGDTEACYRAGMDDYLPKPFDLVKLRRKLVRWLQPVMPQSQALPTIAEKTDLLDVSQFHECLSGEMEVDIELLQAAMEELQMRNVDMQQAFLANDDIAWRRAAHRGVGTSATLGFAKLAAVFRDAEHDNGNPESREQAISEILNLIPATREALVDLGFDLGSSASMAG